MSSSYTTLGTGLRQCSNVRHDLRGPEVDRTQDHAGHRVIQRGDHSFDHGFNRPSLDLPDGNPPGFGQPVHLAAHGVEFCIGRQDRTALAPVQG